ncbi:MAG: XdhC family protein [Desulfovibrio sp.]|jgi:xanthine dehydrogenase accessory factor|nr:XdhC family protein [Desulfovibrio sp.]
MPDSTASTSEFDNMEGRIARLLQSGQKIVLLTVIRREGSVPRKAGTRALLTSSGLEGTIGGGVMEKNVLDAAMLCLESGISSRARYEQPMEDEGIHGAVEALCEVLTPEQAPLFALADSILQRDEDGMWTVDVTDETLPRRTLHIAALPEEPSPEGRPDDAPPDDPADNPAVRVVGAQSIASLLELCKNTPGMLIVNDATVYMEPLETTPVLLICGGGHVALEVAALARTAGFVVDVADDRPEFADPSRFPSARRCLALPGFENLVEACAIGRRHFVVIATRGHAFDQAVLAQSLDSHARYIGMIGSKAKRERIYAALRADGVLKAELAAVRCPVGLPIGAETPAQIAVSIVAELLAAKAGVLQRLRPEN